MAGRVEILWFSEEFGSAERCVISGAPGPSSIEGTAVLSLHEAPASITYVVHTAPDWSATAAQISLTAGADSRTAKLLARVSLNRSAQHVRLRPTCPDVRRRGGFVVVPDT